VPSRNTLATLLEGVAETRNNADTGSGPNIVSGVKGEDSIRSIV
jgi:hypothetical protein